MKITDLQEKAFKSNRYEDENGKTVLEKEVFLRTRKVRTVSSGTRFGHYFIDIVLILIVTIPLQLYFTTKNIDPYTGFPKSQTVADLANVFGLAFYFLFYFLFELKYQKTPGKFVTNTYVVNEYGNPPNKEELFKRTLIRFVPFEPFSCLDSESLGWHDRWSDTFVVDQKEYDLLQKLKEEQNLQPLTLSQTEPVKEIIGEDDRKVDEE